MREGAGGDHFHWSFLCGELQIQELLAIILDQFGLVVGQPREDVQHSLLVEEAWQVGGLDDRLWVDTLALRGQVNDLLHRELFQCDLAGLLVLYLLVVGAHDQHLVLAEGVGDEAADGMHYLDFKCPPLVVVDIVLLNGVHLFVEQVRTAEHEDLHARFEEASRRALSWLNHSCSISPRVHGNVEHFGVRYRLYLSSLASAEDVDLMSLLDVDGAVVSTRMDHVGDDFIRFVVLEVEHSPVIVVVFIASSCKIDAFAFG